MAPPPLLAPTPGELPIVDPWFVSIRFEHGITLVTEPHVHPLLRCNVWHVHGRDRDLVVDTSLGLAPLRRVIDATLERALLAVATHAHSDHVGGLHEFSERAIHRAEADWLDAPIEIRLDAGAFPASVLDPYADAGYDIPDLFVDARPPEDLTHPVGGTGHRFATALRTPAAPATRLLEEGDVIDLGDRGFEVLHLPGHSPGSIGLWESGNGVLFSGDAVYDGPLLDRLDGSDPAAYVATMRRLRRLPVTAVHGGHEASFGRERLVALCDGYLAART